MNTEQFKFNKYPNLAHVDIYLLKWINSEVNTKAQMVLDGPPYANNPIHIGHVLNKLIKDFFNRYHRSSMLLCWDCHGLPIETLVKTNASNYEMYSVSTKRSLCRQHANKYMMLQKKSFDRMGVVSSGATATMAYNYQVKVLNRLFELVNQQMITVAKKPIYFDFNTQTALAYAEIEYLNVVHTAAYHMFKVVELENTYFLTWTTMPWTLPTNDLLCVKPDVEYGVYVDLKNRRYFANLSPNATEKLQLQKVDTVANLTQYTYYNHFKNKVQKVFADPVVETVGTMILHVSANHGELDCTLAAKHKVQFEPTIYDRKGASVILGNQLNDLESANHLITTHPFNLSAYRIKHSYPCSARSKNPVYFYPTEQVFLNLKSLKTVAIRRSKTLKYNRKDGHDTMSAYINSRPDEWCISRQRCHGTPIALLVVRSTGKVLVHPGLQSYLLQKISVSGCDFWFDPKLRSATIAEVLGKNWTKEYYASEHTLDVWFESGLLAEATAPATYAIEGADQYRGWFQSSLLLNTKLPFKKVVVHGYVLDKLGRKMSKSVGNVISFEEIMLQVKNQTDALRLLLLMHDLNADVKLTDASVAKSLKLLAKLRQTLSCLGELYVASPKSQKLTAELKLVKAYFTVWLSQEHLKIIAAIGSLDVHQAYSIFTNSVIQIVSKMIAVMKKFSNKVPLINVCVSYLIYHLSYMAPSLYCEFMAHAPQLLVKAKFRSKSDPEITSLIEKYKSDTINQHVDLAIKNKVQGLHLVVKDQLSVEQASILKCLYTLPFIDHVPATAELLGTSELLHLIAIQNDA